MLYTPFDSAKEYYFDEGCFIIEIFNDASQPDTSIARARVLPETSTRLHKLSNTTERYIIQEGVGEVEIDGQKQAVSAGDVVTILPEQSQKIHNTGQYDLVFLAICTPRFELHNYRDIEA